MVHWHKDGTKCELSRFINSFCQIRGKCANTCQSWWCWNIFPDRFFKTYKQRRKDFWTRWNSKSLQLITQQHLASVCLSAKKMACNGKVVKVAYYSGTQFWKTHMKGGRRLRSACELVVMQWRDVYLNLFHAPPYLKPPEWWSSKLYEPYWTMWGF